MNKKRFFSLFLPIKTAQNVLRNVILFVHIYG